MAENNPFGINTGPGPGDVTTATSQSFPQVNTAVNQWNVGSIKGLANENVRFQDRTRVIPTLTIAGVTMVPPKNAPLTPSIIEKIRSLMPDIQRDFLWILELDLRRIVDITGYQISDVNDNAGTRLSVVCKSFTPPAISLSPIIDPYMGEEQVFPGAKKYAHTAAIQLTEFEDGLSYRLMNMWSEAINSSDPRNSNAGGSYFGRKRNGYAVDAYIHQYSYDMQSITQSNWMTNCWISSLQQPTLTWNNAGAVVTATGQLTFDKYLPLV